MNVLEHNVRVAAVDGFLIGLEEKEIEILREATNIRNTPEHQAEGFALRNKYGERFSQVIKKREALRKRLNGIDYSHLQPILQDRLEAYRKGRLVLR